MSTPWQQALNTTEALIHKFADKCEWVKIAGSIRRHKTTVNDGEVVAIPTPGLHARLESMVVNPASGVTKAMYTNGDSLKLTTRWGDTMKGMMYLDMRVELFLADEHNLGYIYLIRTGPGSEQDNANKELMTALMKSPFKAGDGMLRLRETGQQISLPDEETFFALLNLPYAPPEKRHKGMYARLMYNNYRWGIPQVLLDAPLPPVVVEAPKQLGMF